MLKWCKQEFLDLSVLGSLPAPLSSLIHLLTSKIKLKYIAAWERIRDGVTVVGGNISDCQKFGMTVTKCVTNRNTEWNVTLMNVLLNSIVYHWLHFILPQSSGVGAYSSVVVEYTYIRPDVSYLYYTAAELSVSECFHSSAAWTSCMASCLANHLCTFCTCRFSCNHIKHKPDSSVWFDEISWHTNTVDRWANNLLNGGVELTCPCVWGQTLAHWPVASVHSGVIFSLPWLFCLLLISLH